MAPSSGRPLNIPNKAPRLGQTSQQISRISMIYLFSTFYAYVERFDFFQSRVQKIQNFPENNDMTVQSKREFSEVLNCQFVFAFQAFDVSGQFFDFHCAVPLN